MLYFCFTHAFHTVPGTHYVLFNVMRKPVNKSVINDYLKQVIARLHGSRITQGDPER